MEAKWTSKAISDLSQIHSNIAEISPAGANRIAQAIVSGVDLIAANARIGERVEAFSDREVRRLIVASYEIRYEVNAANIYVLRIWTSRENRN